MEIVIATWKCYRQAPARRLQARTRRRMTTLMILNQLDTCSSTKPRRQDTRTESLASESHKISTQVARHSLPKTMMRKMTQLSFVLQPRDHSRAQRRTRSLSRQWSLTLRRRLRSCQHQHQEDVSRRHRSPMMMICQLLHRRRHQPRRQALSVLVLHLLSLTCPLLHRRRSQTARGESYPTQKVTMIRQWWISTALTALTSRTTAFATLLHKTRRRTRRRLHQLHH